LQDQFGISHLLISTTGGGGPPVRRGGGHLRGRIVGQAAATTLFKSRASPRWSCSRRFRASTALPPGMGMGRARRRKPRRRRIAYAPRCRHAGVCQHAPRTATAGQQPPACLPPAVCRSHPAEPRVAGRPKPRQ
jgi:hypothetical protein